MLERSDGLSSILSATTFPLELLNAPTGICMALKALFIAALVFWLSNCFLVGLFVD